MSKIPLLIELAIAPERATDHERLNAAIEQLVAEDSSFGTSLDRESGQTLIKGVSEAQLDAKVATIRAIHKIHVNVGAPQVAFRETITAEAVAEYQHKKILGPMPQYAKVRLLLEPTDPNKDPEYVSKIVGGAVAAEYLPGVERGVKETFRSGPIAGFPLFGLRVELIDGAYHDIDSSQAAFEACTRAAMRDGLKSAGPVLLQPIMSIEIETPESTTEKVIGDLRSRLAEEIDIKARDNRRVIAAIAPLMNMFGYNADLASLTQGRGSWKMQFSSYAPVSSTPDDEEPFPPAVGMRA